MPWCSAQITRQLENDGLLIYGSMIPCCMLTIKIFCLLLVMFKKEVKMNNKSTNKKDLSEYKIDPAKYWSKVLIASDSDCWDWQGAKNTSGYGLFPVRNCPTSYEISGRTQTQLLAHRVAAFLAIGSLQPYDYVIHKCDNRLCCNPSHLHIGTQQENVDDMIMKGRAHWQC